MTDFWIQIAESRLCTQYSAKSRAQHQVIHAVCYLSVHQAKILHFLSPIFNMLLMVRNTVFVFTFWNAEFFHRDFNFYCTKISLAALYGKPDSSQW